MSKVKLFVLMAVLLLVMPGCNYVAPTGQPAFTPRPPTIIPERTVMDESTAVPTRSDLPRDEAGVPRVPVEQAKAALESGAAIIVDVRSAEAYAQGHIKGAISVPLAEVENNPNGLHLDKNQWIITYCT